MINLLLKKSVFNYLYVTELYMTSSSSTKTAIYFTWSSPSLPDTTATYNLTTASEDCDKLPQQIFKSGNANATGGSVTGLTSGVQYKSTLAVTLVNSQSNSVSKRIDLDLPPVFTSKL